MKFTIAELKQIIKEEVDVVLAEADDGAEIMAAIEDVPPAAIKIANKVKDEIKSLAEPSGLDPLVLAQAVSALLVAD